MNTVLFVNATIVFFFQKSFSSLEDVITVFVIYFQVTECYTRLASLEDVLDWQETLQQYRQEHSSSPLQKAFSTNLDANYIRFKFYLN